MYRLLPCLLILLSLITLAFHVRGLLRLSPRNESVHEHCDDRNPSGMAHTTAVDPSREDIVKRILSICFSMLVAGCVSGPPGHDKADFTLIATKTVGRVCLSAFAHDGRLFITEKNTSRIEHADDAIIVYDPRTGILMSSSASWTGIYSCDSLRPSYWAHLDQHGTKKQVWTYYVKDESLRTRLNDYTMRRTAEVELDRLHRTTLSYSRKDILALVDNSVPARTIEGMVTYLQGLTTERVAAMVKQEVDRPARQAALAKLSEEKWRAEQEARMRVERQAKAEWERRMSYTLAVGDRVCTYVTNLIGDVEVVGRDRIKVHIVGQAQRPEAPGVWFTDRPGRPVRTDGMETLRWFDRDELAKCAWRDGL